MPRDPAFQLGAISIRMIATDLAAGLLATDDQIVIHRDKRNRSRTQRIETVEPIGGIDVYLAAMHGGVH